MVSGGVLVVASEVVGVILIMFFGAAPNFLARRYKVTVNFPAAPGVAADNTRNARTELTLVASSKSNCSTMTKALIWNWNSTTSFRSRQRNCAR